MIDEHSTSEDIQAALLAVAEAKRKLHASLAGLSDELRFNATANYLAQLIASSGDPLSCYALAMLSIGRALEMAAQQEKETGHEPDKSIN
jgi:hypothetical protein